MQIVWNKEIVEKMRNTHTVLELETFDVKGESVTTYCVVPPEKIIADLAYLSELTELHNNFLLAFKEQNVTVCENLSIQLRGRFGGELDSFYEEILKKLK